MKNETKIYWRDLPKNCGVIYNYNTKEYRFKKSLVYWNSYEVNEAMKTLDQLVTFEILKNN